MKKRDAELLGIVLGFTTFFIVLILSLSLINYFNYEDDLKYEQKCLNMGGKFFGGWNQMRYCSIPNELGIYESYYISEIKKAKIMEGE